MILELRVGILEPTPSNLDVLRLDLEPHVTPVVEQGHLEFGSHPGEIDFPPFP